MKLLTYSLALFCCIFFSNCKKTQQETQTVQINAEVGEKTPQSGELIFGDKKLTYFIEGEGVPCFVCADAELQSNCISENLKSHFQFVFIEPRLFNYYEESKDFSHISMDTIVDDLEVLRIQLGFNKIYILGHSIIGLMALEYARKYPENTDGVIMINTPPHFHNDYMDIVNANWEEKASNERKEIFEAKQQKFNSINKDSISKKVLNYLYYEARVPQDWYDPMYDVSELYPRFEYSEDGFNHFLSLMGEYDITKGQLKTPIFLSLGKYDYIMPEVIWDDFKREFDKLSILRFEKSGHYPHVEEQELFDEMLLGWVNDN